MGRAVLRDGPPVHRFRREMGIAVLTDNGAISLDILHFPARVLVIRATRAVTGSDSNPGHGSADLLARRAVLREPGFTAGRTDL